MNGENKWHIVLVAVLRVVAVLAAAIAGAIAERQGVELPGVDQAHSVLSYKLSVAPVELLPHR